MALTVEQAEKIIAMNYEERIKVVNQLTIQDLVTLDRVIKLQELNQTNN